MTDRRDEERERTRRQQEDDSRRQEDSEQREGYPKRRRQHISAALARPFSERPEYRSRRPGEVTCALIGYLAPDFPRGPAGAPKDAEVEELLAGAAA